MTTKLFRASFVALVSVMLFWAEPVSAQPANIAIESDDDYVTVSWDETSGSPVDYYDVEISLDNGGTWFPSPFPQSSDTFFAFPRDTNINVFPVDLDVRIVTVFQDTSTSPQITGSLEIPIHPDYTSVSTRFTLQPSEIVISDFDRKADGMIYWLDGNLGLFERNGETVSVSSNGPESSRILADGDDIYGTVTDTGLPIQNQALASDYAAGGPVYYDEPNDRVIMFYHGEFHDPDPSDFYSYVGLAESTDGGVTFQDLGQILSPNITINDPDRANAVEMAGAPYVIHDGYFYVYFKDKFPDNSVANVGVARALVSDVLADAENGNVGAWTKYYNDSFSQPGIGGIPQDIFSGFPNAVWFDVAYSELLEEYIFIYSHGVDYGTDGEYTHFITTSEDGVTWETPRKLYSQISNYEEAYLTITSPDYSSQRSIAGDSFYLLRTVSASAFTGFRWDNAWVERNEIQINLTAEEEEVLGENTDGEAGTGTLADTGLSVLTYVAIGAVVITAGVALFGYAKTKLPYSIKR